VCGVRPVIRYTGQTRPGDADKWSVDVRRLKALGYAPQYTLAEGLALVRDWCRTNL
jgi:nucleoside-diphosphate-sugar epimerase